MFKRTDHPEDRLDITKNMGGIEKATSGEWYCYGKEPECKETVYRTNLRIAELNELAKTERDAAFAGLREIFPGIDPTVDFTFPIAAAEYPGQLVIGAHTYLNINFLHLSSGKVTIGEHCFIGPNAHFYTPNHHPKDLELRREGWQYDAPITLGNDVWLGGDVILCPGVTIGDDVVIGAGSVVTKDIPSHCRAAGNPCRVLS
jgi:maltose O-acetyltransferase